MKLTRKQLISAAVVTVLAGGIGLVGVASVSAERGRSDRSETMAQRIATKFNLNKDEVKAEMDAQKEEDRAAHQAERKQKREEHLQKLVDEGKITAEQKDAIITKQDEIHTRIEELRNNGKTREENKDAAKAIKDEFKAWAESQGINLEDIKPEGKEGRGGEGEHRGGPRGGMMGGDQNDQNQDQPAEDGKN